MKFERVTWDIIETAPKCLEDPAEDLLEAQKGCHNRESINDCGLSGFVPGSLRIGRDFFFALWLEFRGSR